MGSDSPAGGAAHAAQEAGGRGATGGLSGARAQRECDVPPRLEVRRRARQMQNHAADRADDVDPQLQRVDPHGRPTVFTLLPPDEADWVTETGADVEGPPVPGRRVPGRRYSRGFDCGTGRSLPRRRCLSSPGWPTPWQGPAREGIPAWGLSSPATLGFTSEGSPKLLDFGLAHAVDDAAMVGGTLHYLSPEVLAGRPAEVQRRIRRQRLAAGGPAAAAAPPSAAAVAAFAASILTAPRAGRPGTAPAFAAALAEVPGTAEQNYLQPACSVLSCHTSLEPLAKSVFGRVFA